ncbi:Cu-oxidase-domain-containing protein [Stereum hirsutum FP-91666 SS1]|uniref:Cu-oxidase-domain-containing protein n=1 Tax=Stereum hirsutum (strain FP-91666) TaxID=721885 RepID=UPI000440D1F7|nr:Cu-oxidase-domain-containing protein [Stereum hirsutum FP-91666 SS1]EIM91817.1 Cu-oxidase-domain-containing protein [Stereum hirsutum FP-91666 SS1]
MHSTFLSSVLSALALSRLASGVAVNSLSRRATKAVTLDIVNTELAPDGFSRSLVTANGTYPGPLITATKGDTLVVTVNNQLTDTTMRRSTSIDFDGIFFGTENSYDEGTPFVTTCPIGPNATYTYEVPLINDQAGTFWYHSQLSVQYSDGLRGPLVVYDPEDPLLDLYDVDGESTIIQLGDWWHNASVALLTGYVATGIVPVSDSGTVNGVGRYNGGPEVPWSVTTVTPGLRHRLRIINQSMRNVFTFSIDGHNLTIVEADGVATQPLVVDEIEILAGQRYSVILNADQPVDNYWINAPFVGGDPTRNLNQNATLSRAILRYTGANESDPTGPLTLGPANGTALVEADLHPLIASPPPVPDVNISLNLVVTTGKAQWNVNNVSYLPPDVPTLIQILNGANDTADFNVTENTFVLPANKTIQIDFPANDDDEAHPFHLHGNNFWVIKSNSSDVVNTVDPVVRDVVGVGAAGTTLRFRTDNPGPWFFHCHIFWHMQAGLATVMASGLDDTRAGVQPDDEWSNLCPSYFSLPEDEQ